MLFLKKQTILYKNDLCLNQLVAVQQGFLCTPLEGVWSLRNTINLHGGHSDQLSTTFMLCADMQTESSAMKQVGGIKLCRKYSWVTCAYSQQDQRKNQSSFLQDSGDLSRSDY